MNSQTRRGRLSRREFLKRGASGVAVIGSGGLLAVAPRPAVAYPAQAGSGGDLVLVNGKFVDGRGVVGTTLSIKNGRIVKVGQALDLGPGAQRIDLGGRTVIPGFFDSHAHYTRAGINPG